MFIEEGRYLVMNKFSDDPRSLAPGRGGTEELDTKLLVAQKISVGPDNSSIAASNGPSRQSIHNIRNGFAGLRGLVIHR